MKYIYEEPIMETIFIDGRVIVSASGDDPNWGEDFGDMFPS